MKKQDLFRCIEEFNGVNVQDAIDYVINFCFENAEDDERLSDACKRIKMFHEEVAQSDPLDMFLQQEIPFRLNEFFGIQNPSQELINAIDYDGLDDCEGYLDNEYIDMIIREQIKKRYKELKESNTDSEELKVLEKSLKEH